MKPWLKSRGGLLDGSRIFEQAEYRGELKANVNFVGHVLGQTNQHFSGCGAETCSAVGRGLTTAISLAVLAILSPWS
jgi:hypothetical protein